MKIIRMLLTGWLLGVLLGLWMGVNIGKGHPIFSNPFAKENLSKKIKQRVGESIEQLGEDIKGQIKK